MFVALSKFEVANGMIEQVKSAFVNRPHLVDNASGFIRMDVISPLDRPNEIWLVTYWTDESSYKTWHHGELHRQSHQWIPKGLKLVPRSTEVRFFEYVSS
jgi:heme-degrading monooxygenase HmoA